MLLGEMEKKLEKQLTNKRYIHSVNVMNTAAKLAERYGADNMKSMVAGLLHDCARKTKESEYLERCMLYGIEIDTISRLQPILLHGPLGAEIARQEYGVEDEDVLRAIMNHTTGRKDMSTLEKIIYVADMIEPGRDFPGDEYLRKSAFKDLDTAFLKSLNSSISFVMIKGGLLHPASIEARNQLLIECKRNKKI